MTPAALIRRVAGVVDVVDVHCLPSDVTRDPHREPGAPSIYLLRDR